MATTIRQTVAFDAPPHAVFEALLDSRKHSAFTGQKASISRRLCGHPLAGEGHITGRTSPAETYPVTVRPWRGTEFQ